MVEIECRDAGGGVGIDDNGPDAAVSGSEADAREGFHFTNDLVGSLALGVADIDPVGRRR